MANDTGDNPKEQPEETSQTIPGSLKTRLKAENNNDERNDTSDPSSSRTAKETGDGDGDGDGGEDDPLSAKHVAGKAMTGFSDLVNENLIAFRYGTVATVTLLTAYGLANTPLFFRYKTARDIPGMFVYIM
jgi:hypothetical protein